MKKSCNSIEDLIELTSKCPSINKIGLFKACESLIHWTLFCELLKEVNLRSRVNSSLQKISIEQIVFQILSEWFGKNFDQWPIDIEFARKRIITSLKGKINEDNSKHAQAKKWLLKINPTCQWKLSSCKEIDSLELDHKWPRSLGGTSDKTNVQLLCRYHNALKGYVPIWGEIEW